VCTRNVQFAIAAPPQTVARRPPQPFSFTKAEAVTFTKVERKWYKKLVSSDDSYYFQGP
jgi:hypothetical protein